MTPAIELIGIDKRFGAVHANKDVTLTIAQGSIHGIIGENGAGKSTLMSILFGFYHADKGEIKIRGEPVKIKSSADAISHGIGMVHQHFMLVDPFTVLENVVLGAEGGRLIGPALAKARDELTRLAHDYELDVDPDALVGDEDHGFTLVAKLAQDAEQVIGFIRGEDACRFIKDQGFGTLEQGFENFDTLLEPHGQFTHKGIGVNVQLIVMRQPC